MQIRESTKGISLIRYGGKVGDKQLEVKIATVDPNTKPSAIPQDVVDELTPRELQQLKDYLRKCEDERNDDVAKRLARELDQLREGLSDTKLGSDAASTLLTACNRIKSPLNRYIPASKPATAAPEKTSSASPDEAQRTQQEPNDGDTQVAIDSTAVEPPTEATESS